MPPVRKISVIGIGKLGSPLAAILASKGFEVIGVDSDRQKVEKMNQHKPPVFEPGLAELLNQPGTRLRATSDIAEAVSATEVSYIVVPTPSEADGGFSLKFVLPACEEAAKALKSKSEFHLAVITSTVMPGHTEHQIKPLLEKISGKRCGIDFGLCYNPEFIALGSAIRDMLNPDFILIGESDKRAGDLLASIYEKACDNKPSFKRMNFVNAEIAKISVNTFVTTKISFANMLARICEKMPEADVDIVTSALGLDTRIGPKYLKGAIGYGGPCFPRDNLALISLARALGAPALLAEATDSFNRRQVKELVKIIEKKLPKKGTVGILGLSYKPNTDVTEQSQGILLAEVLSAKGIKAVVYDPVSRLSLPLDPRLRGDDKQSCHSRGSGDLNSGMTSMTSSAGDCIQSSDVVVITTPWEEFKKLEASIFARPGRPRAVIDCWRILPSLAQKGIEYIPLGVGSVKC